MKYNDLFPVLFFCVLSVGSQAQNEYAVLQKWQQHKDSPNVLYHHLAGQAYDLLGQRAQTVKRLSTLKDWQERQMQIRKKLAMVMGPFPEKTPLNPVITNTIQKSGYRVEHVVFESRPGFYVTSSLYLPTTDKGPLPAILYCSGHSDSGYRSGIYQHTILNLVQKGFVVLAFDPVGQGERLSYLDPGTGKSMLGAPTREHFFVGAQVAITGGSLGTYMVWDGIRALDYLLSRPEVDPARLGITGRSGGGMQSAYLAALDERILAAAPEAYLTTFTRLLESVGPQDAEQNFTGQISAGLDHADFLVARAPRPTLMITTTNDMFSIQGTMDNAAEVARAFKAFGKPDHFARVEDLGVHESTKKNREAMYAFFQKHLHQPGDPADQKVVQLAKEELKVTSTGQVAAWTNAESVFSLNAKEVEKLQSRLTASRQNLPVHLSKAVARAKVQSGYREPDLSDEPVYVGKIEKNDLKFQKYYVKGEGGYVLPFLLVSSGRSTGKAVLYLHPGGKGRAMEDEEVEKLARAGTTVLVPDLPGTGELGPGSWNGARYFVHAPYEGLSYQLWTAGLLIGKSIVGTRASDVVKLTRILLKLAPASRVEAIAFKTIGPVLLHAAAFDSTLSEITLIEPLASYRSLATTRLYRPEFTEATVPDALPYYDLPDLAASLAPRKLTMVNPVDGAGQPIRDEVDVSVIKESYQAKKSGHQFKISTGTPAGSTPEGSK